MFVYRFDLFFEKEVATEKQGVGFEARDWGTSAPLYCGLKNISSRVGLLLIAIFTFINRLLNSFALYGYGLESRERFVDVSRGWRSFDSCSGCEDDLPGGRICPGKARVRRELCKLTIKWTSSKTKKEYKWSSYFAITVNYFSLTTSGSLYILLHKKWMFLNMSAKIV